MARKLVGQNATVKTRLGNIQNGTPGVTGTPVEQISMARRIFRDTTMRTVDTTAIGDQTVTSQATQGGTEITLELFVPITGEQFVGKEGYYIEFSYALATGLTAVTYVGVISGQSVEVSDGATVENLRIMVGAN